MSTVQIVYASRHGGTRGIAERLAAVLRAEGADVTLADAAARPAAAGFDAHVIGSGVYVGRWLREAVEFVERNQSTLAVKPVWLFSSGPLPHASETAETKDPLTRALGPQEGPGSGGRKRIDALAAAIHPRDHRVFLGAFDPNDPPKSMQERLVRLMPAARRTLPTGDFREWDAIDTWARTIAAELTAKVAAG